MKTLVTWILAHLLAFAAASSHAAEAGRVLLASGDVIAIRGQETVRLSLGAPIQENDMLRTGPASHLHVRFADEAVVSMRENSELRIDEFRFAGKEDGSERMFMSLLKGGLRTITGLIGKTNHQNYRMSTTTATIGIRGTDYSATLCQQDCRNANGSLAPDGLYGRTHGASSGTNKIDVSNTAGSRTLGINENFYVADNKSAVQPILVPPAFLVNRPQPRQSTAARRSASAAATRKDSPNATTKSAQSSATNTAGTTGTTTKTGTTDTATSTGTTGTATTGTTDTATSTGTAGTTATTGTTAATSTGTAGTTTTAGTTDTATSTGTAGTTTAGTTGTTTLIGTTGTTTTAGTTDTATSTGTVGTTTTAGTTGTTTLIGTTGTTTTAGTTDTTTLIGTTGTTTTAGATGTTTLVGTTGSDSIVTLTTTTQEQVTVTASSGFQAESRLSTSGLSQPTLTLGFVSTETLSAGGSLTYIVPKIAALGAFNDPNNTGTSQGGAFFVPNQLVTDPANAAGTLSLMQQLTGFSVSGDREAVTTPNAAQVITGSTTSSYVIDETTSNPINANWGRWMSGSFSSGTNTTTFSSNNQFHYLYGPLTPPEVIAAKSGTVSMTDFYGTTPTNQAGQSGSISYSGSLNVNFTARTVDVPQVTMIFSSSSEQYSFQSVNAVPIQIRTGQGAFITSTASGTYYTNGSVTDSAKLGITGIFMGATGDHLGVSLNAKTTTTGGPAASAQTVRLFSCSPC